LRQVARDLREAEQAAIRGISDGRDDDVRPETRPVFAHAPAFTLESSHLGRLFQLAIAEARADIFFQVEPREVLTDDLVSRYPLMRSAPRFQVVTIPFASSMKIA
jgi:hypothetical protein